MTYDQESKNINRKRRIDGARQKRKKIMKRIGTTISMLVLASSLAGSAIAADEGFITKDEAVPSSYCHEKFPAIRQSTLGTDDPQLKSSQSGDVIDYYGSCDESPTGADQVQTQHQQNSHHFAKEPGHGF
jgi:hypothetical protein